MGFETKSNEKKQKEGNGYRYTRAQVSAASSIEFILNLVGLMGTMSKRGVIAGS